MVWYARVNGGEGSFDRGPKGGSSGRDPGGHEEYGGKPPVFRVSLQDGKGAQAGGHRQRGPGKPLPTRRRGGPLRAGAPSGLSHLHRRAPLRDHGFSGTPLPATFPAPPFFWNNLLHLRISNCKSCPKDLDR